MSVSIQVEDEGRFALGLAFLLIAVVGLITDGV